MKKAKTRKNIFSILSVVLGVVFALITGVTYCVTTLTLAYNTNPSSASAYLGNQQYVMINDTTNQPISYGEGVHNFEIAMQYSMSYNFDVRLKYQLQWSGGGDVGNVVLNFANRDNIICDEEYIYLANPVTAGNGKITFITGVNFVDTNNSAYYGKSLTINIEEKIYKAQDEYDRSHILYADAKYTGSSETSLAAETWLAHKPKTEEFEKTVNVNNANILMYNYRRSYDYGIKYPGTQTAYKKVNTTVTTGDTSTTTTTGATWLGGNKSYAGTAMYVVTGAKAVELSVQVNGVWYSGANQLNSSDAVSENAIKYNYSTNWSHYGWVDNQLWEVRTFDYIIPANSTYYIDILDSIEITSASKNPNTVEFDKYRMVTNQIIVSNGNENVTFDYKDNDSNNFILKDELSVDASSELVGNYTSKLVSVVNTSLYSNGLYDMKLNQTSAVQQTFNTSISLINNTNKTQTVELNYSLYYYLSNGNTNFYDGDENTPLANRNRAEAHVYGDATDDETWTNEDAFESGLAYGYAISANNRLTSNFDSTIVIAPYSSVSLVDEYSVAADLQKVDLYTQSESGVATYSDVWTYLDVQIAKDGDQKEKIISTENPSTANLAIETTTKGSTVSLSVKNNTNSTITDVEISSFSISEMTKLTDSSYRGLEYKPADWIASYWKYYKIVDGKFVQLTTDPIGSSPFPQDITYYEKIQSYTTESLTFTVDDTKFEQNSSTITLKSGVDLTLQPGESVVFATATTSQSNQVIVKGYATSDSVEKPNSMMLINNGTEDAYLINNTTNSYFLRFTGTLKNADINNDEIDDFKVDTITSGESSYNLNHYLGIVRPGQIIKVPMSVGGSLSASDVLAIGDAYDSSVLINASWDEDFISLMDKYFALVKTI